ncbi:MAG TPA: SMC-Scp complex subunit ScpB [Firmicutes bacterium]|jgi:segregation and condensation protein B|nr:SMC-Scp complex subunit ScpB [Bacillota bacterium]HBK61167.1 SMC-Scp complex subunit ScpB [Bacillota bacterium]
MNLPEAQAAIEAILFAASFPLAAKDLAAAIEVDEDTVAKLLREIRDRHSVKQSGVALRDVDGSFILMSKPEYAPFVENLSARQRPQPLSPASLETLSIVAYRQPVTRGEVDRIRGVSSDSSIATLTERGLICEVGRRNSVGRPVLYGTTDQFLIYLGLSSLSDLPPLPESDDE